MKNKFVISYFSFNRLYSALVKSSLFILLEICVISSLAAQTQKSTRQDSLDKQLFEYKLKPVTVTAIRVSRAVYEVPYAIEVLVQKNAELQLSLEETLREVPGVIVNNRNNLSQGDRISIRGIGSRASFGVRGIKIILDDIPLTMPDGQSQLNNLDLSSAGSIEILRGPNSSSYGNASGGVLNIQTEFNPDHTFLLTPKLTIGAYGLQKWQVKSSLNYKSHNILVNFYNLKLDGYRDHSSASMNSVNLVGRFQINKDLRLKTVFNFYDSPYLLNPSSLSKVAVESNPKQVRTFVKRQGAAKEIRQAQGGVSLLYGHEKEKFKLTLYGISRSLFNPIPGRIIDLSRQAGGIRSVFSKSFQMKGNTIRIAAGVDIESQSDVRLEFINSGLPDDIYETLQAEEILNQIRFGPKLLDQNEEVFSLGPFAKLEFSLRQNMFVTLGGRYDFYKFKVKDNFLEDEVDHSGERTMNQFSPMVGLIYRRNPLSSFFVNYSTAFQTPTTTELSNQVSGAGGFNPELGPENIISQEVGFKGIWLEKKVSYELSLFNLQIKNMLIPYQVQDPESEEIFFRNAGKTKNYGVEFKSTWFPTPALKATVAYTYMHFIFEDFVIESSSAATGILQLADNEVPGISPHRIFAGITYKNDSGFFSEINLKWNDDYFANDLNGPTMSSDSQLNEFVNPSYFLVDIRFGIQNKLRDFSFLLFLGVNNIFDKRYNDSIVPNAFGNRFFEPAPGRNWYTSVSFPISILK